MKELWEELIPHRELIIKGLGIETCVKGQPEKTYESSGMSDGERVIFYLIGQCLAAPRDGIIVIDEPELHLHKSVQAPLWSAVEKLREDCLFVYLTHDVDFAASLATAKKVWLRSFDGRDWDWELIDGDQDFPDDLLLEVLGSRKSVVFVEGENGSLDVSLYREILSNFLVIPRGSCSQVIQSVKALKMNSQIHHLEVYGIIDRDRRSQREIDKLEENSVYVLNVSELENLFCTKEVLKIVSDKLERDSEADFQEISDIAFSRLEGELESQVSLRASSEIRFMLNMFDMNQRGVCGIGNELQSLIEAIDVDAIYSEVERQYNDVLENRDYGELLALYNRKTLSSQVSSSLGLANGSLPETIIRLAKGACKDSIRDALRPYFGNFSQYIG